jgi:hypothetical protein
MKRLICIVFLFSLIFNGCIKHNPPSWETFVSEFVEGYFKLNPDKASLAGRHEYDGLISDYSDKGIKEQIEWLKKERELVSDFIDPILSESQRIEKKNLIRVIDENLFWLETMKWPGRNAGYYFAQLSPSNYTQRNYAPLEQRFKAYIRYLVSMKTAVAQIQENLSSNAPLPAIYIDIARNIFTGYANQMRSEAPQAFKSINNDKLQQDFRSATEEAVTTILNFVSWLKIQEEHSTDNYNIGANNFLRMIYVTDFMNAQIPELKALIEKDLQDNSAALKKACRVLYPGKTVEECLEFVKSKKPEEDPITFTNSRVIELENFIKENKIASIPKYSSITILPAPQYMNWVPAYAELPVPYEKTNDGKLYISCRQQTDVDEDSLAAIPSEAELTLYAIQNIWPGEFLYALHYSRARSLIARLFYNNTTFKGWSGYAQDMMIEQGFKENTPILEIEYRRQSIINDAGLLAAIKIHTEGKKINEAAALFMQYAYSDSTEANQQALFAAGDPQSYSAAFGKILIKNLRDEWLASKQNRHTLKAFNDRFMACGLLPVPIIREILMRK